MRNRTAIFTAISVPLCIALAGCSLTQKSPVPGVGKANQVMKRNGKNSTKIEPVSLSAVIVALKGELSAAFLELEAIKVRNASNPAVKGLNPQVGSAIFNGSTQLVHTDSGNVLAIIPFTGYVGSQLSPTLGISSKATSIENIILKFSFDPARHSTNAPAPEVSTGGFVRDCLISAFQQLASVKTTTEDGRFYDPKFKNQSLSISVSFAVVQQGDASMGVKLVPTAPDLDSIEGKPGFGVSRQKLGTYKLDLEIPLIEPNSDSAKRIISGAFDKEGKVYLIDRPYDEKFHKAHSPIIGGDFKIQFTNPDASSNKDNPFGVEPEFSY